MQFPGNFHHHTDWDDETQPPNYNGGHNSLTFSVDDIRVNDCGDGPHGARRCADRSGSCGSRLSRRNWRKASTISPAALITAWPSNSSDFVAVVEAPLDERRVLAVIDAVYELIPNKPIRYVVNSHHHFDHLGGVRTMFHEGATIVTHESNRNFYKQEVLSYASRLLEPDRLSLYPPTELAEGYQLEAVDMKHTISDGTRNLDVYYVQGSPHAEGMLMAYLPTEKILIEADVFTPPAPGAQPPATPPESAVNLYDNVQAYNLDVTTIAPLHGLVVPWGDLLRFVGETE